MKVTVVGAGNVGATVANVLATKKFCSEALHHSTQEITVPPSSLFLRRRFSSLSG